MPGPDLGLPIDGSPCTRNYTIFLIAIGEKLLTSPKPVKDSSCPFLFIALIFPIQIR